MFGISWAEFIVILLVTILVVPARYWPDVARAIARLIKFVRGIIWKITDASEKIKSQIELEKPIDEIMNTTTRDMLDTISVKRKPSKKRAKAK
jgi:Sec-independent protein translocase protein TatA